MEGRFMSDANLTDNSEAQATAKASAIATDKLAWLAKQCRSPRPRLGTLTLEAMADLAQAVHEEVLLTSPESMGNAVPYVAICQARDAVVAALGRVVASIGGG